MYHDYGTELNKISKCNIFNNRSRFFPKRDQHTDFPRIRGSRGLGLEELDESHPNPPSWLDYTWTAAQVSPVWHQLGELSKEDLDQIDNVFPLEFALKNPRRMKHLKIEGEGWKILRQQRSRGTAMTKVMLWGSELMHKGQRLRNSAGREEQATERQWVMKQWNTRVKIHTLLRPTFPTPPRSAYDLTIPLSVSGWPTFCCSSWSSQDQGTTSPKFPCTWNDKPMNNIDESLVLHPNKSD